MACAPGTPAEFSVSQSPDDLQRLIELLWRVVERTDERHFTVLHDLDPQHLVDEAKHM